MKEEGVHNPNVQEIIEEGLVPSLGLVDYFIVSYQCIREVHSTHALVVVLYHWRNGDVFQYPALICSFDPPLHRVL